MSNQNSDIKRRIDRRTVLRSAGVVSGAALVGTAGVGGASAGKPCFKDFEGCEEGSYVKVEFVECKNYDDEDDCPCDEGEDCCFITVEDPDDTGFEIANYYDKSGEEGECEPVEVEWSNEFTVLTGLAYGGQDCEEVDVDEEDNLFIYESGLTNDGGQDAAISNLQLCVTENDGFQDLDGYQVDLIYGDPIYDFSAGASYNQQDRLLQAIKSCSDGLVDRVDKDDDEYASCDVEVTDDLAADTSAGTASATIDPGSCDATEFNLVVYAAAFGEDCDFRDSEQELFQYAVGGDGTVTDNGDGTTTFTVDLP